MDLTGKIYQTHAALEKENLMFCYECNTMVNGRSCSNFSDKEDYTKFSTKCTGDNKTCMVTIFCRFINFLRICPLVPTILRVYIFYGHVDPVSSTRNEINAKTKGSASLRTQYIPSGTSSDLPACPSALR